MRDQEHAQDVEPVRGGSGFNRRDFLKGSGAAMAATALATAPEAAEAKEKATVLPAAPSPVTLTINGREHKLTLEPRVTLLEALRNDLSLTGCKDVCDSTNCGACTVLLDGKPTYACAVLAHGAQGKKITTVEGLVKGDQVDAAIKAFVKHDATQCGYCTPGFVVAVRGFCDKHPGATLDDVLKGLGGNICRCGTYAGVTQAALECAGAAKGGA